MNNISCTLKCGDFTVTAEKENEEPTVESLLEVFEAAYIGVGFVNDLDIEIQGSLIGPQTYQIKAGK